MFSPMDSGRRRSVAMRRRFVALAALTLALTGLCTAATRMDTGYLAEMPPAARIQADMGGRTARDNAARTTVALTTMVGILRTQALGRALTPQESAKLAEYTRVGDAIYRAESAKSDQKCAGDDCDKYLFPRCVSAYVFEPTFYREVIDRYFSPPWQQRYLRAMSGTVWQTARSLPAGTKLSDAFLKSSSSACTAGGASFLGKLFQRNSAPAPAVNGAPGSSSSSFSIFSLIADHWLLTLIALWLVWRALHSAKRVRRAMLKRSNAEALEQFGPDRETRERAILEAFDSPDFTFRYAVTDRSTKMYFVLLRNIKSFRHGDLEAMRFAYLTYNRGLISDEQFHWFRFSAIYGGGATDPAEWKSLRLFARLGINRDHTRVDEVRDSIKNFAGRNGGKDVEGQALATIQKLVQDHPQDRLYADMRRRMLDGVYWLTQGELKRSAFAPSDTPYSLTFGVIDGTDTELIYAGDGSVMTVAPPGSGKTQCNVFPNLLRWPGPAVVFDVKGEIYDSTSRWRAANVGPVIKFSPLDPTNSACFNPLSSVRQDAFYIWEDARFLASMMIVPVAKEPFWEDKAREILTAIIADICYWNAPDKRPMTRVLSIINRNGWTEFVDRLRKNPDVSAMRDEGNNFAHMDPRTLDGALQTAKASLSAWVGERIAQATGRSDWHPLDLRNGKNMTLYVCVKPNEIDAYLSLLRVVIAQHIRSLTSGEIPPRDAAPVLFVLDELPRLKAMPPVEEALEVGRGYGIKLWMFAQSVGQMRAAYANADGMMGSCAVRTFMNPSLQDGTAKMLSEQIGYRSGEQHGGKDGTNKGPPKPVVDAPELAGADFKELQIVMGVGSKPARVRKRYAWQDQTMVAKMGAASPAPKRATA